MATAKKTAKAVDPLASLTKGVTRKVAKKPDENPTIVLKDAEQIREVGDMIRLGVLSGEVKKLFDVHKKDVTTGLFRAWTNQMWKEQAPPDNPRLVIKKLTEAGEVTTLDDMEVLFQVKFRADGLDDLPDASKLPEGMTVEDTLLEALTGEKVGLSEENAIRLIKDDGEGGGEIVISYPLDLTDSFNGLYNSEDETVKSAVTKLIAYLNARTQSVSGVVRLPQMTDEEKNAILTTHREVRIKDGFFDRAHTYCRSADELFRLLSFTKTTLAVTSLKFGVSDKKKERAVRLNQALYDFIVVGAED